jgi:DNA-repair protein XRCC1
VGEKSCFVIFKLDKPRVISGIDIGNEHSGFIEVLVGNSKQTPPVFKEILLATSFMTIIEANNNTNPNRVRCFTPNALVESVAKEEWDLVKVFCTQPFNHKLKYGLSFVTLHSPGEAGKSDESPVKTPQPAKAEKSKNFGKFSIRANSDSDDDDKAKKKESESPFNRWKSSKGSQENKPTIKEQVKTKIEENRKRIRVMEDSSDEEQPKEKVKPKPGRNRMTGLVYEDEDDEPNDKLQKKLDKDKSTKDQEKKPKLLVMREKSPAGKSKFSSFIDDDLATSSPKASTSSSSDKKHSSSKHSPSSSKHSSSSRHSSSSSKHQSSSSPSKKPSSSSSHKKTPEKSSDKKSDPKNVTYKPFDKLLEGVVFVFSGYVNPERGILRQKALDMGAKYRSDWDSSCTHLM